MLTDRYYVNLTKKGMAAQKNTFRLPKLSMKFEGLGSESYKITFPSGLEITGTTAADGTIEIIKFPPEEKFKLIFTSKSIEFEISVNMLEVKQNTGFQARLKGRGYYEREIDGIVGEETKRAIEDFQRDFPPLIPSGIKNDDTEKKLAEVYGS